MPPDLDRYHRQMLLPGFGLDGQRRLLESTALVLGCGALGTVVADTLARAGVGHLVVADRDFVELTNLQRQTLFDERDVEEAIPKAEAARRRLARVASGVRVTAVVDDVDHTNIERYASQADVLVDGVDNFETRYLANDYAVARGVPYVYGGAVGSAGTAFAVLPHTRGRDAPWERQGAGGATPCLRCLFEEPPQPGSMPTCDTAGVLAPAAAMIASFEAAEALKILTRNYDRVCRTMLEIDLWGNTVRHLPIAGAYAAGDCPCCKHGRFEFLSGTLGSGASALCGGDAVQLKHHGGVAAPDLTALAKRLARHGSVAASRYMVRADITDDGRAYQLTVFPDGRAIVKGTNEASVARSLYARYVGA